MLLVRTVVARPGSVLHDQELLAAVLTPGRAQEDFGSGGRMVRALLTVGAIQFVTGKIEAYV